MSLKSIFQTWCPRGLLAGILLVSSAVAAAPMVELQRAVRKAEMRAEALGTDSERQHRETLEALNQLAQAQKGSGSAAGARRDRALAAFTAAEKREAAATIGNLQNTAALRQARQVMAEAVNAAVEQGDALERAANRALNGELAPSVSDALACDGPDCVPITLLEHAALILIGAVGPAFDPAQWPPANLPMSMTVIAYTPDALPLITLRHQAEEAVRRAQVATARADTSRAALEHALSQPTIDPTPLETYGLARASADASQAERAAVEAHILETLFGYAAAGRALKRAALLAGDGYALKAGGDKACNPVACVSAEGLEAAAFVVIGAAEDIQRAAKSLSSFVTGTADGRMVFAGFDRH